MRTIVIITDDGQDTAADKLETLDALGAERERYIAQAESLQTSLDIIAEVGSQDLYEKVAPAIREARVNVLRELGKVNAQIIQEQYNKQMNEKRESGKT